jgi:membrane protease YdiL (CAAX protease family)
VVFTILFFVYSARLPSVRSNFIRLSWLKILALTVAITAAFCEETIFRKLLMDALQNHGFGIMFQLAASGAAFGLAHAIWGLFRGSISAALRVVSATRVLGLALASVYIVSDRVVAPCIVAHFLMNLFAKPGLVLSALTREMSNKAPVRLARGND